ncbi:hypothetical protein VBY68_10520 [Tenacibaculum ascidiaceicola]
MGIPKGKTRISKKLGKSLINLNLELLMGILDIILPVKTAM